MHVVFVTTELATENNSSGGLASFTANMARIFAQNGHDVIVIVSTVRETELIFDEGIKVINSYMPKKTWERIDRIARILTCLNKKNTDEFRRTICNIYRSWKLNREIRELYKNQKVDIVHFCSLSSVALWSDKRIPHVVRLSSLRNLWRGANYPEGKYEYEEIPLLLTEKLHDYVLKKQSYIISPSNWLAEVVKEYINPNVTVLESPFELERINWNYEVYNEHLKGKKYIIYFGSLRYFKGTQVIVQLVQKFLIQNPDMYLVLSGVSENMLDSEGNSIKAHELIIQNAGKHGDRVLYMGGVVREKLYPLIQEAELCLLPSRIENLSNASIEALAMGKIVVATAGPSYEQVIEDRVNGFLCERDNPDAFLQGITDALNLNEEDKEKMSLNAKRSVARLQPECIYMQYKEYYEKVIREW